MTDDDDDDAGSWEAQKWNSRTYRYASLEERARLDQVAREKAALREARQQRRAEREERQREARAREARRLGIDPWPPDPPDSSGADAVDHEPAWTLAFLPSRGRVH